MEFLRFPLIIAFIIICNRCQGYKPVLLMHGINDGPGIFDIMTKFIQKVHPGTNVTALSVDNQCESLLTPMWKQANDIIEVVTPIMKDNPDGVHLLGFSQGGLVCRAMLQLMDTHNVQNFISLSSPQAGQYGATDAFGHFFPKKFVREEMYRFFYTSEGQKLSVGNYWNDPHHQDLYLNRSVFLPVLNNQTYNKRSKEFKENFTRLKNLVLIGGPQDGVITPWQSSHFAAYDDKENVVEMKQQKWYTEDWFGLRTLDKRGAVHIYQQPNIEHHHWVFNFTIFQKYIEPWLT